MQESQLYIGLMSGTSMDGVDAVLVRMDGSRWQGALAHSAVDYPDALKQRLLELQDCGHDEIHRSRLLAQELSRLYAQAVAQLLAAQGLKPQDIAAIGCHGQTVRHAPQHGYSVQLADLALLAELSGIFTVGDFRSRDLAAGGQGAPLVPAFHQALFADETSTRVVLNIGGIANISVLLPAKQPENPSAAQAWGFDTGAGNMLMDAWARHIWQEPYDAGGRRAAAGRLLPDLLAKLSAHPYFRLPYPKSTGRELFSLSWLQSHLNGGEDPHDVQQTLLQFTVRTIADAVFQTAPQARRLYVCGGGTRNGALMAVLSERLQAGGISVADTSALQFDPQWVEAAAFAWLAACWCLGVPSNSPRATGAGKALVLGAGYHA